MSLVLKASSAVYNIIKVVYNNQGGLMSLWDNFYSYYQKREREREKVCVCK